MVVAPVKTTSVAVLAIVLVGGAGAWWWPTRNGATLTYTTAPVQRGDVVASITATGTIEPMEVVDVGAQVAGRISLFGKGIDGKTIDYGSAVEEGAVLARIDDAVYVADLAVANAKMEQDKAGELGAKANLAQSKAKLVQAEAGWNRAIELYRAQLLATPDYDSAKAGYEVGIANVAVAEAAIAQATASTVQSQAMLDRAQRNLGFCTIKSPVTGVIIDRRVNIGQTVVASLNAPSLFLIAKDLANMQIWVAVNEADVGRIVRGAPVTFTCDTFPGREFSGTVAKVRLNATMTQNVVMYTVEVNTDNPDHVLLPYLTANVHFILSRATGVLLVPNAALRWAPSSLDEIAPDARPSVLATPDPPAASGSGSPPSSRERSAPPTRGTVWLKDGEHVRPLDVVLGISDSVNTAVAAEGLRAGQVVITGEIAAAAQADAKNPFLPRFIRR